MSEVQEDDVREFASLLRRLKDRTDRSYGQLARRLNMNTSTLHRYCAGDAVPLDFAPVERFAALCRATPQERLELHRLWIGAVAARRRTRTPASATEAPATEASAPEAPATEASAPEAPATEASAPRAEAAPDASTADEAPSPADGLPGAADVSVPAADEPVPDGPSRPWYRRRLLLVCAAVATTLLVTLGSLSALPDDRPRGSDSVQGAGRSPTAETDSPRPTPTKSASPSPSAPSPSTGPSKKSSAKPDPTTGSPSKEPPGPEKPAAGLPFTWSADSHVWQAGCGHDYVVAKPPRQVAPPPAPQDARVWATSQDAVHGKQTMVKITVQGRSSTAVVLDALRVRVVGRSSPMEGTAYAMDHGCGGALTPRYFDVDLDKDRPIARPADGNDMGTPIPAVRLPYRVSAEDPEVLLVTAQTTTCDCTWYLELDWSSQGRTGTVRIDDQGRPFRTTSIEGMTSYAYDTSVRRWVPYS